METVTNELLGIVEALFRHVGVAVGSSVALSGKIAGLGVSGAAVVTNLAKQSYQSAESAKARNKAQRLQRKLKKVSSEQKELKQPSPPTVATIGNEKQAEAIAEQPRSQLTPEPEIQFSSKVTEEEVEAAVFAHESDRIIFLRNVSDIYSPDVVLRAEAIKTIACKSHELTIKIIMAQLVNDPSEKVRQECINALVLLKIQQGLPAVKRALRDPAASVRLAAVWGLYHLGGQESIYGLLPMVFDEDDEVRRRAVTCIGWLGKREYALDLIPLLTDKSIPVRRAVAKAVGNLGLRQTVSALIERLNDADKSVRDAVLDAIEKITGKNMKRDLPSTEGSLKRFVARWREWWKQELMG